jgi:hypothetical protein
VEGEFKLTDIRFELQAMYHFTLHEEDQRILLRLALARDTVQLVAANLQKNSQQNKMIKQSLLSFVSLLHETKCSLYVACAARACAMWLHHKFTTKNTIKQSLSFFCLALCWGQSAAGGCHKFFKVSVPVHLLGERQHIHRAL